MPSFDLFVKCGFFPVVILRERFTCLKRNFIR